MSKPLEKSQKKHFANLDINSTSDSKTFWQIVKPLFSNKVKGKTTIKLVENDEMIDDEIKISKLFNDFVNIVKKARTVYKRKKCNFHRK